MPDNWLGGSRRNVLRNILVDERGREVNYDQGVGGGAGYNQHDAYGFHGAGRIFSLTPQMCLRVRVRLFLFCFFSRIALRKDQGGIWQNKSKETERNGRARRFAMVFFLSLSLYPSLSFSLYLVFLHVKRLEPNNEIACVSFSFPGSGFACFDGIFGLFVGGRGAQLQTSGFLFMTTNKHFGRRG
jgi:hypothetical protein